LYEKKVDNIKMSKDNLKGKIELLKGYFSKKPDISMAFVFGSYAKGQEISESDFDVAVYFRPENKGIEWEGDKNYKNEDKIWLDIEKIVKRNVDLIVLNRAPSNLAFEVLRTGISIIIKNRLLHLKFFSQVSFEAIDFRELVKDYWAIKQRSLSLTEADKGRLIRMVDFLETELKDFPNFTDLDQRIYESDASKRREVERWAENLVNCSIDIAKVLLASEKKRVPDTYKNMLRSLFLLPKFDEKIAQKLAGFAGLRNLLAHEYLDVRFNQIKKFTQESEPVYKKLIGFVKNFLNQKNIKQKRKKR